MLEYDLISSAYYQSSASVTSYLIQQLLSDFVYLEKKEPYPQRSGKFLKSIDNMIIYHGLGETLPACVLSLSLPCLLIHCNKKQLAQET